MTDIVKDCTQDKGKYCMHMVIKKLIENGKLNIGDIFTRNDFFFDFLKALAWDNSKKIPPQSDNNIINTLIDDFNNHYNLRYVNYMIYNKGLDIIFNLNNKTQLPKGVMNFYQNIKLDNFGHTQYITIRSKNDITLRDYLIKEFFEELILQKDLSSWNSQKKTEFNSILIQVQNTIDYLHNQGVGYQKFSTENIYIEKLEHQIEIFLLDKNKQQILHRTNVLVKFTSEELLVNVDKIPYSNYEMWMFFVWVLFTLDAEVTLKYVEKDDQQYFSEKIDYDKLESYTMGILKDLWDSGETGKNMIKIWYENSQTQFTEENQIKMLFPPYDYVEYFTAPFRNKARRGPWHAGRNITSHGDFPHSEFFNYVIEVLDELMAEESALKNMELKGQDHSHSLAMWNVYAGGGGHLFANSQKDNPANPRHLVLPNGVKSDFIAIPSAKTTHGILLGGLNFKSYQNPLFFDDAKIRNPYIYGEYDPNYPIKMYDAEHQVAELTLMPSPGNSGPIKKTQPPQIDMPNDMNLYGKELMGVLGKIKMGSIIGVLNGTNSKCFDDGYFARDEDRIHDAVNIYSKFANLETRDTNDTLFCPPPLSGKVSNGNMYSVDNNQIIPPVMLSYKVSECFVNFAKGREDLPGDLESNEKVIQKYTWENLFTKNLHKALDKYKMVGGFCPDFDPIRKKQLDPKIAKCYDFSKVRTSLEKLEKPGAMSSVDQYVNNEFAKWSKKLTETSTGDPGTIYIETAPSVTEPVGKKLDHFYVNDMSNLSSPTIDNTSAISNETLPTSQQFNVSNPNADISQGTNIHPEVIRETKPYDKLKDLLMDSSDKIYGFASDTTQTDKTVILAKINPVFAYLNSSTEKIKKEDENYNLISSFYSACSEIIQNKSLNKIYEVIHNISIIKTVISQLIDPPEFKIPEEIRSKEDSIVRILYLALLYYYIYGVLPPGNDLSELGSTINPNISIETLNSLNKMFTTFTVLNHLRDDITVKKYLRLFEIVDQIESNTKNPPMEYNAIIDSLEGYYGKYKDLIEFPTAINVLLKKYLESVYDGFVKKLVPYTYKELTKQVEEIEQIEAKSRSLFSGIKFNNTVLSEFKNVEQICSKYAITNEFVTMINKYAGDLRHVIDNFVSEKLKDDAKYSMMPSTCEKNANLYNIKSDYVNTWIVLNEMKDKCSKFFTKTIQTTVRNDATLKAIIEFALYIKSIPTMYDTTIIANSDSINRWLDKFIDASLTRFNDNTASFTKDEFGNSLAHIKIITQKIGNNDKLTKKIEEYTTRGNEFFSEDKAYKRAKEYLENNPQPFSKKSIPVEHSSLDKVMALLGHLINYLSNKSASDKEELSKNMCNYLFEYIKKIWTFSEAYKNKKMDYTNIKQFLDLCIKFQQVHVLYSEIVTNCNTNLNRFEKITMQTYSINIGIKELISSINQTNNDIKNVKSLIKDYDYIKDKDVMAQIQKISEIVSAYNKIKNYFDQKIILANVSAFVTKFDNNIEFDETTDYKTMNTMLNEIRRNLSKLSFSNIATKLSFFEEIQTLLLKDNYVKSNDFNKVFQQINENKYNEKIKSSKIYENFYQRYVKFIFHEYMDIGSDILVVSYLTDFDKQLFETFNTIYNSILKETNLVYLKNHISEYKNIYEKNSKQCGYVNDKFIELISKKLEKYISPTYIVTDADELQSLSEVFEEISELPSLSTYSEKINEEKSSVNRILSYIKLINNIDIPKKISGLINSMSSEGAFIDGSMVKNINETLELIEINIASAEKPLTDIDKSRLGGYFDYLEKIKSYHLRQHLYAIIYKTDANLITEFDAKVSDFIKNTSNLNNLENDTRSFCTDYDELSSAAKKFKTNFWNIRNNLYDSDIINIILDDIENIINQKKQKIYDYLLNTLIDNYFRVKTDASALRTVVKKLHARLQFTEAEMKAINAKIEQYQQDIEKKIEQHTQDIEKKIEKRTQAIEQYQQDIENKTSMVDSNKTHLGKQSIPISPSSETPMKPGQEQIIMDNDKPTNEILSKTINTPQEIIRTDSNTLRNVPKQQVSLRSANLILQTPNSVPDSHNYLAIQPPNIVPSDITGQQPIVRFQSDLDHIPQSQPLSDSMTVTVNNSQNIQPDLTHRSTEQPISTTAFHNPSQKHPPQKQTDPLQIILQKQKEEKDMLFLFLHNQKQKQKRNSRGGGHSTHKHYRLSR